MQTDDQAEDRSAQYIIYVRAQRCGNIIAYMGAIIARGLVLEQDENYEAGEHSRDEI